MTTPATGPTETPLTTRTIQVQRAVSEVLLTSNDLSDAGRAKVDQAMVELAAFLTANELRPCEEPLVEVGVRVEVPALPSLLGGMFVRPGTHHVTVKVKG